MECCKLHRMLKSNGHLGCVRREQSKSQFAAIDSHIDFMELPVLSVNEPFGQYTECNACIKPEFSMEASIISLIATYRMFYNIVVFAPKLSMIEDALSCIPHEFRNIVIITPSSMSSGCFCIYSRNPDKYMTVNESGMIKFVKNIVGEMSLTMYLYPESVCYAYQFQETDNSLWVTTCSNTLRMVGTGGSRTMPMFYVRPSTNNVLHINAGSALTTVGGSGPGLQQKLYSITNSTLNSVSKDGACYFCAYMQKCHDVLCKGLSKHTDATVELSVEFRPNVDNI